MRWLAAVCGLLLTGVGHAASPSQTLDAFHDALRRNQPDRVVALLAREAVIYEQGFAERSRDEWIRRQLGPAIAFAADTRREVVRRELRQVGEVAWVISSTRTTVSLPGQPLTLNGAETAILRLQADGSWRIVHLHWSAHEADTGASADGAGTGTD